MSYRDPIAVEYGEAITQGLANLRYLNFTRTRMSTEAQTPQTDLWWSLRQLLSYCLNRDTTVEKDHGIKGAASQQQAYWYWLVFLTFTPFPKVLDTV